MSRRDRDRAYYLANWNKIQKQKKEYARRNPERMLRNAAKTRANRLGLPFDIELEDIIIPEYCPVLGIKLESKDGRYGNKNSSPSLDRIQNELGYVKGNVQVISYKANRMKNDATFEEIEKLYLYWKSNVR